MLRIALCDDDVTFLNVLKDMTISISRKISPDLDIDILSFSDGQQLIDNMSNGFRYDLIMLDWDMPGMDGEKTGKAIRSIDPECLIIFITSYSNYAIPATKLTIFRYLLKDKLSEELPEALRSTYDRLVFNERTIQIRELNRADHLIKIRDIIAVENRHAKTTVYLKQKTKIETYRTFLSDHVDYLLQNGFAILYKGILANCRELSEIALDKVIMSNGIIFPLSRRYKQDFYLKVQRQLEVEL